MAVLMARSIGELIICFLPEYGAMIGRAAASPVVQPIIPATITLLANVDIMLHGSGCVSNVEVHPIIDPFMEQTPPTASVAAPNAARPAARHTHKLPERRARHRHARTLLGTHSASHSGRNMPQLKLVHELALPSRSCQLRDAMFQTAARLEAQERGT
jgi:hypothetical protein